MEPLKEKVVVQDVFDALAQGDLVRAYQLAISMNLSATAAAIRQKMNAEAFLAQQLELFSGDLSDSAS